MIPVIKGHVNIDLLPATVQNNAFLQRLIGRTNDSGQSKPRYVLLRVAP